MTARVFDAFVRHDAKPGRHGETWFEFLNRSASSYYAPVRDLIENWFSHVPREHQASLRGGLCADNHHSTAAFWELYLHEAYLRSGFDVEIHPELPNRSTRPDFRLAREGERFYLEAVSVGRAPSDIAEDRRLDDVHRTLTEMRVEDFTLELSTYGIGPQPLATRRLRGGLREWLTELDPDEVAVTVEASPGAGFESLPEFVWEDAGWSLVFHAVPLGEWARGTRRSALGVMGPGEAVRVDNETGVRRVLESKRSKYGALDAPLVLAVLSNTEYPTYDFQVERALYGVSARRPRERSENADDLLEEGFWIARTGWSNSDVPQVLTAYGLAPWTIAQTLPRCWSTLEPDVILPVQPSWLAPIEVGAQSMPGDAPPIGAHFGLPNDWPGPGEPDFDLS